MPVVALHQTDNSDAPSTLRSRRTMNSAAAIVRSSLPSAHPLTMLPYRIRPRRWHLDGAVCIASASPKGQEFNKLPSSSLAVYLMIGFNKPEVEVKPEEKTFREIKPNVK
jgi:hypothetical protein